MRKHYSLPEHMSVNKTVDENNYDVTPALGQSETSKVQSREATYSF